MIAAYHLTGNVAAVASKSEPWKPPEVWKKYMCGKLKQKPVLLPKTINVARATCSSFFKKFENIILKFQKNQKLNIQVDNVVIYNCANFQVKIPYSLCCAKMTNSEIYNSEQCRFSKSHHLSEFVIFV
jgi:hypothetical protein